MKIKILQYTRNRQKRKNATRKRQTYARQYLMKEHLVSNLHNLHTIIETTDGDNCVLPSSIFFKIYAQQLTFKCKYFTMNHPKNVLYTYTIHSYRHMHTFTI